MGCSTSKSQVGDGGARYSAGAAEGDLDDTQGPNGGAGLTDIGQFAAEHKQVSDLLSPTAADPAQGWEGETPTGAQDPPSRAACEWSTWHHLTAQKAMIYRQSRLQLKQAGSPGEFSGRNCWHATDFRTPTPSVCVSDTEES